CLLSLNPFLKFDGYWVVADALGVTNLGRQPARVARRQFRRLRGEAVEPLPWPPLVAWAVGLYALATTAFLAWFLAGVVPVVAGAVRRYAALLDTRPWPFGELATATFVLLFAGLAAMRLARAVGASLRTAAASAGPVPPSRDLGTPPRSRR